MQTSVYRHSLSRIFSALCVLCAAAGLAPLRVHAQDTPSTYPWPLNNGALDGAPGTATLDALALFPGVAADAFAGQDGALLFRQRFGAGRMILGTADVRGRALANLSAGSEGPAFSSTNAGAYLSHPWATLDGAGTVAGETQIHVSNVSLFRVGDRAAIATTDGLGRPVWTRSIVEEIVIDGITAEPPGTGGLLTVRRNQLGTTGVAVISGGGGVVVPRARVGDGSGRLQWNFSLDAPAESGKRPHTLLAEWFAGQRVTPDATATWNGFVFSGWRWQLDAPALDASPSPARPGDANNDGLGDNGYATGSSRWGLGQHAFYLALKNAIAKESKSRSMLVAADAREGVAVSAWPGPGSSGANGLWINRFPAGSAGGDFDSAWAELAFWRATVTAGGTSALAVVSTETNTAAYGGGSIPAPEGNAIFRLGLAAATLADAWHTYATEPGTAPGRAGIYSWDEYFGGSLATTGWLGAALESAQRDTSALGEAVGGGVIPSAGWSVVANTAAGAKADAAALDTTNFSSAPDSVRMTTTAAAAPLPTLGDVALRSPSLGVIAGGDWTLRFRARTVLTANPSPLAALVRVSLDPAQSGKSKVVAGVAPVGNAATFADITLTFSVDADTSSGARLLFETEGNPGSLWIDDVQLRPGNADRFSRRFQAGIVLLNASNASWDVQLPATYRRLQGSIDSVTNDGSRDLATVTVPANDALFLAVDSTAPTPTAPPVETPTPSPSPTATPSPSRTPLPTATPSPSLTPLPTLTPEPSATPPPTASATPTASVTPTMSVSPTVSVSPTISPTPVVTDTPYVTPSRTPTPSATPPLLFRAIDGILARGTLSPGEWNGIDANSDKVADVADIIRIAGR